MSTTRASGAPSPTWPCHCQVRREVARGEPVPGDPVHPSMTRTTTVRPGAAVLGLLVVTIVACSSGRPLPRAQDFHGEDCAAVAIPVVQVARAARDLGRKPADTAALGAMTNAQAQLRDLPAVSTTRLPE